MPYTSSIDLPPSIRDHIADDHGRRLFMHVFNSAWERGDGEEAAFRQAWGALKRAGGARGETATGATVTATPGSDDVAVCY